MMYKIGDNQCIKKGRRYGKSRQGWCELRNVLSDPNFSKRGSINSQVCE